MTDRIAGLIGIPYTRMNCWQLVREFYWVVYGLELLHAIDDPFTLASRRDLIYTHKSGFQAVQGPEFGALAIIKMRGYDSHIAVCLDSHKMLHTLEGRSSLVDHIAKWQRLVAGYYRLRTACDHA